MNGQGPTSEEHNTATGKPPAPVLEYTTLGPERVRPPQLPPVLFPFAAGAFLPFLVAALAGGSIELFSIGLFVTWGECGALLLAIKIRGALVTRSLRSRKTWSAFVTGISNSVALWTVVRLTTARQRFSPLLGEDGTILLAFLLAGAISSIVAILLTPQNSESANRPGP